MHLRGFFLRWEVSIIVNVHHREALGVEFQLAYHALVYYADGRARDVHDDVWVDYGVLCAVA